MADVTVVIDGDGNFTPGNIRPNPGDKVTFESPDDDVVLCVTTAAVFGQNRYEIPTGAALTVTVKEDAINVGFGLSVQVGTLEGDCGGARGNGNETGP